MCDGVHLLLVGPGAAPHKTKAHGHHCHEDGADVATFMLMWALPCQLPTLDII